MKTQDATKEGTYSETIQRKEARTSATSGQDADRGHLETAPKMAHACLESDGAFTPKTTQDNPMTKQDDQSAKPGEDLKQRVREIVDERNRLVRSVIQQPADVLRDLAILAIGWAMHELEVREGERDKGPLDLLSWAYGFRIIGLADGEYGIGMSLRAGDDGSPQLFDTSTRTLVAQLRKYAEKGAGQ